MHFIARDAVENEISQPRNNEHARAGLVGFDPYHGLSPSDHARSISRAISLDASLGLSRLT